MTPSEVLTQARDEGVSLQADGGAIRFRTQAGPLPGWLRTELHTHKPALLKLLTPTEPPPLTHADREDSQEAIDERAAIQEYDGGLPRAEAERQTQASMRVYRYRLTTSRGWCTLIAPGWSIADAERNLRDRYGGRLVEVQKQPTEARRSATARQGGTA